MVALESLRIFVLRKINMVTKKRRKAESPLESDLVAQIWEAKASLDAAQSYFNSVADPDLVDHAVYMMEAARRRYAYLLKQARQAMRSPA